MNALTLLKQDHQNVEALFERFEKAGDQAFVEKRKIVDKIIDQLSVHAVIEEQVLYPAIRAKLTDEVPSVLEALEEHHAVKMLLAEIEKLAPQAERFTPKVTVMIENVRHHVKEEEDELFPKVRDAFTVEELNELGEILEQAKETAPTRPHPLQPDQPPANVVLGLPIAILDRMVTVGREAFDATWGKVLNRK
jgi:hemerythrin superfamily protein